VICAILRLKNGHTEVDDMADLAKDVLNWLPEKLRKNTNDWKCAEYLIKHYDNLETTITRENMPILIWQLLRQRDDLDKIRHGGDSE
jgi:hypothetical protein